MKSDYEDFEKWVSTRFSDLAEDFVEENEDKFSDFAWKKFEKYLQIESEVINGR